MTLVQHVLNDMRATLLGHLLEDGTLGGCPEMLRTARGAILPSFRLMSSEARNQSRGDLLGT